MKKDELFEVALTREERTFLLRHLEGMLGALNYVVGADPDNLQARRDRELFTSMKLKLEVQLPRHL
ncbi:hypothetical protein SAMN05421823_107275 [Catalinimonas alkaloidigena]|uniref:Uncharacterized protein n=1 Tax=Catalinimonas alkaloidigena TaxID=1075417 RepID=A0A1G9M718_9BACT|nr:hypothetical protein [Catalinimonas alkaloidigena]SDL69485.1 hypothetical protein SAMN05421823_107275 [Catalinimonas alkaloidigena]